MSLIEYGCGHRYHDSQEKRPGECPRCGWTWERERRDMRTFGILIVLVAALFGALGALAAWGTIHG